jgi:hypothetical protein
MSHEWIWAKSATPPKCKLTKWEKQARVADAEKFLDAYYRPTFILPPPPNPRFNYIVDFSASWHGSYLRFTARYACPGPTALAPFFEVGFARLGYFNRDRYNLWARRHNDQWFVLGDELTLPGCFAEMRANPWFQF